jgi:glycosyltransferase involved in cell wall biosynthesis
MAQSLQRHGCEIAFFLHLQKQARGLVFAKDKVIRLCTGKHIIVERDPRIVCHYPEQINETVHRHPVQAVIGTSSFYMANQSCPVPSVFWGDTTVAGVLDNYPYYTRLNRRSVKDCHELEAAALSSCMLAVFSNQWAADVACANYTFDQRKVRVIPYGANLLSRLNADDIATCISRRETNAWELIFVGLDWYRKGAPIAIDAAAVMRARGANVRLTLVGCVPPRTVNLPEYVTVVGRIDKATQKGRALLSALYRQSHLLILPSRAECAAVSLSEASAHGVPSLSTNVGGNSTLIQNGVNGYLLPLEAGASEYAEHALQLLGDPSRYSAMCWSSFERFQTELNWDVAVLRFLAELKDVLGLTDKEYACSRAS